MISKKLITLIAALMILAGSSFADQVIKFGPAETEITGSIKYSGIGKYKAKFNQFRGEISFNNQTEEIKSVYLEIEAETIESNCEWCDNVVRSKKLLHTEKYPKIIFKSDVIIKDEKSYRVKGTLEMHGVKKEVIFPFDVEEILDEQTKQKSLAMGGKWLIKRKDFDIYWNRLLDKGGVLVGEHIIVDWKIKSLIQNQSGG